jgi:hypothetical protein
VKRAIFEHRALGLLSSATGELGEAYWSDDAIDAMDQLLQADA